MTVNQKLGRLIQQTRQQRGLTQAELAKLLGTSQSAVNRIEHGNQNLSLETLARLSDALEKPLLKVGGSDVSLRINGGKKLSGSVDIKSSKNAAVGLLMASLLNRGTTTLKKVSKIEEVYRIIEVLESIGVQIRWKGSDLIIKRPAKLQMDKLDTAAAIRTRSVIMMLGPLMHEFDKFSIPFAGGCKLGKRTVKAHQYALEELGVTIHTTDNEYQITSAPAPADGPIIMYESGDTPTENIIMAAAKIPGKTVIKMASANYMGQDVCFFLQDLGVKIEGIGSTTLTVHGTTDIKKNVEYSPSEDPVEAMTFIAAAVTTDSTVEINRVPLDFTELEIYKLKKMGLRVELLHEYTADNGRTRLGDIRVHEHGGNLNAPSDKIYARPFPGLNIDHLPYFVPIAAVANGRSLIHDWVYENRAIYYTELSRLGVDIQLADPHRVYVEGPTKWKPADLMCPPALRPAVINLIGMLAAPGASTLRSVYTINRGYEQLAERLNSLGADIEIVRDL
ncbi:MAG: UDP-N-acetylglucosamine 1-carboxyvinyltransferase [Patescibacteria group bacterium]